MYLLDKCPCQKATVARLLRLVGRSGNIRLPSPSSQGLITTRLGRLDALLNDIRTTLRMTDLLPLLIWLKSLSSRKNVPDMDPTLRYLGIIQSISYVCFEAIESICHLTHWGIIPANVVGIRGGIDSWIAWSCRAWLVGIAIDFLRLSREAKLNNCQSTTASKQARSEFARNWWKEFTTALCWVPVALEYSQYPRGIGLGPGGAALFGFMAEFANCRQAWASTA